MDPFTAIAILAAHLICSGALFIVIARRIRARDEAMDWAAGGFCFGAAFVGRLLMGLGGTGPLALVVDALMVLAVLLFARGMAKLSGRTWPVRHLLGAAAVLVALHTAVALAGGPLMRFVFLNALLGGLYLLLGLMSWRPIALRTSHERQRLPLAIFAAMVGLLGVASLARAAHIAENGLPAAFGGPAAAAYFALSSLVAVLLVFVLLWIVFERLNGELAELASFDALTRVFNRNGLQLALQRHFAARAPTPLTLLLVDLDHFKGVNDRHGHAAGDALLKAVADCLVQACRGSDFVARFGGEEFLVGCGTDKVEVAERLARRICTRAAALRVPDRRGGSIGCTVSVGISATVFQLADWETASHQADTALYRAKADGRNRWSRFEPASPEAAAIPVAAGR
jgi:diguanylate cyclase (GGDEF)-like protein